MNGRRRRKEENEEEGNATAKEKRKGGNEKKNGEGMKRKMGKWKIKKGDSIRENKGK